MVDLLYDHLKSLPDSSTIKEELFHVGSTDLKPDIVHIKSGCHISVIDPTVRVEKDMATREAQIIEKIEKYAILKQHLAERYNIQEHQVKICPVWMGSRRTILKSDLDLLEKNVGKLPKKLVEKICQEVVSWSATIYNSLIFKQ